MEYKITAKCRACGKCAQNCPVRAIGRSGQIYKIDVSLCMKCGRCVSVCPFNAVAAAESNGASEITENFPENMYGENMGTDICRGYHKHRHGMRSPKKHGLLNGLRKLFSCDFSRRVRGRHRFR